MTISASNFLFMANKALKKYNDLTTTNQNPHAQQASDPLIIHLSQAIDKPNEDVINDSVSLPNILLKNCNNRLFPVAHASAEECVTSRSGRYDDDDDDDLLRCLIL